MLILNILGYLAAGTLTFTVVFMLVTLIKVIIETIWKG